MVCSNDNYSNLINKIGKLKYGSNTTSPICKTLKWYSFSLSLMPFFSIINFGVGGTFSLFRYAFFLVYIELDNIPFTILIEVQTPVLEDQDISFHIWSTSRNVSMLNVVQGPSFAIHDIWMLFSWAIDCIGHGILSSLIGVVYFSARIVGNWCPPIVLCTTLCHLNLKCSIKIFLLW